MSLDSLQWFGHLLGLHEVDKRRLGISPGQVRKYLIDGLQMGLLPLPELAFSNKDVAAFLFYENVRLSLAVKCLTRGGATVLSI